MLVTKELLEQAILDGWVKKQKHPTEDLWIYNYTPKAQYDFHFDGVIAAARGLILDGNGNIVARPFPKFFSYDQLNGVVPDLPFEVYDKCDGSLLISHWIGDKLQFATRGSFASEQAIWANQLLDKKYSNLEDYLNRNYTYLFEFVSPRNKIVVNYKEEDIILLAIIHTATGEEISLPPSFPTPIVKRYDYSDLSSILKIQDNDREGFVIKYSNNYRIKIKFSNYLRLHRLLTGVTARTVWDLLRNNQPFEEMLENVDDVFYTWITDVKQRLLNQYVEIEQTCKTEFKSNFVDRKSAALYYMSCTYPDILFMMLDGKDYSSQIWKKLRPEHEKPYLKESE